MLSGFLTNCCVESTMRTAYEKGFNVVTLTDAVATTSDEGQAVTGGSYGMFSQPMTVAEFSAEIARVPTAAPPPPAAAPAAAAVGRKKGLHVRQQFLEQRDVELATTKAKKAKKEAIHRAFSFADYLGKRGY